MSSFSVYVISVISIFALLQFFVTLQNCYTSIGEWFVIFLCSCIFAFIPTIVYYEYKNEKVEGIGQCISVEITNHIQQEINRSNKHGGPYVLHTYYVKNAPIPYFTVSDGEPLPTIKNGLTTIKVTPYQTNGEHTVRYTVDTSAIVCN